MKKLYFIVVCFLCFSFYSLSQNSDSTINWTDNVRLEWNEFRGAPDMNSNDKACTYGSMKYGFQQTSETECVFKLYVYFEPSKSWVKHGDETPKLLIHEQCHFDIYEIFARKMIKKIESSNFKTSKELNDGIGRIFRETFNQLNAFQDQYDRETDHSRKEEKQIIWTKKVRDMLDETKPWAKRELTFKVTE